MYTVKGTTIQLIRGDTLEIDIELENYTPTERDKIRFAMKKKYEDDRPLIIKEIPIETMTLRLEGSDTKPFDFGEYYYDIQLTKADGTIDTFINRAKIRLLEEVD